MAQAISSSKITSTPKRNFPNWITVALNWDFPLKHKAWADLILIVIAGGLCHI
jgi:hypothetical protein